MAAVTATKKQVAPIINNLPATRTYKHVDDHVFGFKPYERRVIITCFKGRNKLEKWKRWFVRLETARRRMIDLAMDNGHVGDLLEVAHINGLQFCTLKIELDGQFTIKMNPKVFRLW